MAYHATYVLGDSATMIWMIVAMNAASLATMPVIPRLVARIFLTYPLTDTRYHQIVEEVRQRHALDDAESSLGRPPDLGR